MLPIVSVSRTVYLLESFVLILLSKDVPHGISQQCPQEDGQKLSGPTRLIATYLSNKGCPHQPAAPAFRPCGDLIISLLQFELHVFISLSLKQLPEFRQDHTIS